MNYVSIYNIISKNTLTPITWTYGKGFCIRTHDLFQIRRTSQVRQGRHRRFGARRPRPNSRRKVPEGHRWVYVQTEPAVELVRVSARLFLFWERNRFVVRSGSCYAALICDAAPA